MSMQQIFAGSGGRHVLNQDVCVGDNPTTRPAMPGPSSPSRERLRPESQRARFKHSQEASMNTFCAIAILAAVMQPLTSAPQLLIPAAGSTPGANGTFWRSDIAIANFADHDQLVRLQWLPQGASSTFSKTITLHRLDFVRSNDFVAAILGQSGLGAILVTGVTNAGDLDPAAALYAQSRIWTPQPGSSGTMSESLPAIPTSTINTPDAMVMFPGVLSSGNYRLNVGIVNLDPTNAQTINIVISFGPVGNFSVNVTVPPMGMQQASLGSGFFFPEMPMTNATDTLTRTNKWMAYVSTIDNVSGDAWADLAVAGAPVLNFTTPIGKN
jgi:hypothetical protein